MLYIFLGIGIALIIVGIIRSKYMRVSNDTWDFSINLKILGSMITGVSFIISISSIVAYNATKSTVDSKIKILEEQNQIIVEQVEPLVEKYLNYEKEIA